MPQIKTSPSKLKNRSSDRPEYLIQNAGPASVKFDFQSEVNFSNDSGFILNSGDTLIINGRMAAAELYAVSGTGSNRILIADPGRQLGVKKHSIKSLKRAKNCITYA